MSRENERNISRGFIDVARKFRSLLSKDDEQNLSSKTLQVKDQYNLGSAKVGEILKEYLNPDQEDRARVFTFVRDRETIGKFVIKTDWVTPERPITTVGMAFPNGSFLEVDANDTLFDTRAKDFTEGVREIADSWSMGIWNPKAIGIKLAILGKELYKVGDEIQRLVKAKTGAPTQRMDLLGMMKEGVEVSVSQVPKDLSISDLAFKIEDPAKLNREQGWMANMLAQVYVARRTQNLNLEVSLNSNYEKQAEIVVGLEKKQKEILDMGPFAYILEEMANPDDLQMSNLEKTIEGHKEEMNKQLPFHGGHEVLAKQIGGFLDAAKIRGENAKKAAERFTLV